LGYGLIIIRVLDVTFELIVSVMRTGVTDVFVLIVVLGIHFSQMFLGKKFIPELYKLKV